MLMGNPVVENVSERAPDEVAGSKNSLWISFGLLRNTRRKLAE
jgi:hypothetical protein